MATRSRTTRASAAAALGKPLTQAFTEVPADPKTDATPASTPARKRKPVLAHSVEPAQVAPAAPTTRKAPARKPRATREAAGENKPPARAGARTAATRDPERTSAAILAAAVKEFREHGYGGARIDAIAKRANINKRMLYHYFGDKDALYLAVLEGAYMSIRAAETRLHLSDLDPVDGVRELILFTWHYYQEHPEFLSLLGTENLLKAKFLKRSARIFDLNSPLISTLSQLLQRGEQAGQFRPGQDALDVYLSIAGLGFFYLSNRYTLTTTFRRDLGAKDQLERWGDHIVDVILSYLRA